MTADPAHPWGPTVPLPGSEAAVSHGCRCPVLDNAHGRGYMGGPGEVYGWVIVQGCPLHDLETPDPRFPDDREPA